MATIYRKTAKGLVEIETRQHRLTPRSRSALILVDGKRDVVELKTLLTQQADETLALLLEHGLIEVGGKPGAAAEPTPEPSNMTVVDIPLAIATAIATAPKAAQRASGADFASRQRAAVRDLNDVLGPSGESLAVRIERSRDAAELRILLQASAQAIFHARDRAAAEAFLARHEL